MYLLEIPNYLKALYMYRYLISVLSIVPQWAKKRLSFLFVLATGFQIDVYRGGIIDKTVMYEAVSRTHGHDISIWV